MRICSCKKNLINFCIPKPIQVVTSLLPLLLVVSGLPSKLGQQEGHSSHHHTERQPLPPTSSRGQLYPVQVCFGEYRPNKWLVKS